MPQEQLAVAPITPTAYDSRAARQLAALSKTIGAIGGIADDIANAARRAEIERERAANEAKSALEGQTTLLVGESLPQRLADIDAGKYRLEEGETAQSVAARMVDEIVGPGASEIERTRARELASARLQTAILNRESKDRDETGRYLSNLALQSTVATTDPTKYDAAADELVKSGIAQTKEQADTIVALNALKSNALVGDSAAYEYAKSRIPEGVGRVEIAEAETEFRKAQNRAADAADGDFRNFAAQLETDRENGLITNTMALQALASRQDKVSPVAYNAARSSFLNYESARMKEIEKETKRLDEQEARVEIANLFRSSGAAANVTGGYPALRAKLGDTVTIEHANGDTTGVSIKEIEKQVLNSEMARIAASYEGDSVGAINAQTNYLALNNTEYEPYKQTVAAAVPSAYAMASQIGQDGRYVGAMPANLSNAIAIRDTMMKSNKAIAERHVPEADRQFWTYYDAAMKGVARGDSGTSAAIAANAVSGAKVSMYRGTITRKMIDDNAGWINKAVGDINSGTLAGEIELQAKLILASGAVGDAETAVEQANEVVKRSYKKVDRTWVYDPEGYLPDNADEIFRFARDEYARKYASDIDAMGMDKGDMALIKDARSDGWTLVDVRTGAFLPRTRDSVFDKSLSQLTTAFDAQRSVETAMKIEGADERRRSRQEYGTVVDRAIANLDGIGGVKGDEVRRFRIRTKKAVSEAITDGLDRGPESRFGGLD
jgi:hypothetical protein